MISSSLRWSKGNKTSTKQRQYCQQRERNKRYTTTLTDELCVRRRDIFDEGLRVCTRTGDKWRKITSFETYGNLCYTFHFTII